MKILGTAVWLLLAQWAMVSAAEPADVAFFERQIRPLLVNECVKCHGAKKQSGDLRLDTRAAMLRGGETGAAIVARHPDKSLLISAVRRDGDFAMPPEKELSEPQVAALIRWIEHGAVWPDSVVLAPPAEGPPHWAFQPVADPPVPTVRQADWVRTPVDAFVLARLEGAQLAPSPVAGRRTLIRRATFDLTGLPPTPEEVASFVQDDDAQAYALLIDRLLDSPHYGEKWGRHWLDVARYSDTKGYVYAREERSWVHAWAYRDWVVQALNNDLPYNRFLLLQLAADQLDTPRSDLAAMGFLTLGRRFLGVTHDIIDDRIDVVTRGTMGLTVACARCHDHKYDPIPTRDYYSLYGVFQNCVEDVVPLADVADAPFAHGLEERSQKLRETMARRRAEAAARVRARLADYLVAQLELEKYPEEGFDQILVESDIMPAIVRRWRDYLARAAQQNDPVFAPWRRFREIPQDQFAADAVKLCRALQAEPPNAVHPRVAAAFTDPPADLREVALRYGALFAEVDRQWQAEPKGNPAQPSANDPLLQVLYGPQAPCEVPDEPIVNNEQFFPSSQCEELWKLQGEVDRWLINSPRSPPQALILRDREVTTNSRVLKRGNPATLSEEVPRQFLELIAGPKRKPFSHGSGRLELARAIVDPANPLTARVAVNRVWMHHFGAGLVRTPSDLGRRAELPSHPELLDWLTSRFIDDGWSLKSLHRRIMLSNVYQQSSFGPANANQLARGQQLDPENRLLWRMNTTRLSFEELRDAALAVTGELQRDQGGKPGPLFGSTRRTLYARVDRQFLPSVLRVFDFANPDLHIAQRSETVVPQQALFFMNHPFLVARARQLASTPRGPRSDEQRVSQMYRAVYQRDPTVGQLAAALALLAAAHDKPAAAPKLATEWTYGFGEYQPDQQRLTGFQPLPHFNGKAWQGGPKWPDVALGWVQLTATGGHAGNDKQHAAVRRWTAPRAMRVKLASELIHPAKPGDGIRGFLVSSRQGLLHSAEVHQRAERFDVDSLSVEAGETIDFVVDLRDNLNHEEYLWEAKLTEILSEANGQPAAWNSSRDFGGTPTHQLNPWEQLAQVLLSANEFLFVD